jgi:hypothetical protein
MLIRSMNSTHWLLPFGCVGDWCVYCSVFRELAPFYVVAGMRGKGGLDGRPDHCLDYLGFHSIAGCRPARRFVLTALSNQITFEVERSELRRSVRSLSTCRPDGKDLTVWAET